MALLHVGLIGAGFIGVSHANAIEAIVTEELVSAEFTAVCDTDPQRAEGIAASFGARENCTDAIALIDSGKIDTVFICTPTQSHPSLVEAAARRGLNIFCEKPLARSLEEARRMQAAVANAGVANQVGLVLRYSPVCNVIKELISDPSLGRPMAVVFRDDQYFPVTGIYGSTWRGDVDIAGGGTLIEHSIHDVDILRWLFGEIKNVNGRTGNFKGHEGIEDLAVVQLEFESGCTAQLTSTWHNILGRESNRFLEIFFENGYFATAEDFLGSITCQTGSCEAEIISRDEVLSRYFASLGLDDPKYASLYSNQGIEDYHFLRALETGTAPKPDFDVAVKAHEIVEAIYLSARDGTGVSLRLQGADLEKGQEARA